MSEYLHELVAVFEQESNASIALQQKAYLRNQFEFYGIPTTRRRELQRPFLINEYLPPKEELDQIVRELWNKPQREYHYFSQELVFKYLHAIEKKDIALLEFMVTHKSWWDTVDFLSIRLMGGYFARFPEQKEPLVQSWLLSTNIWLKRSALLFQLKYRDDLDPVLLSAIIHSVRNTKEFFINKAIGWALRAYSKTDPGWVISFVNSTALSPLSKREALRLLKK